MKKIMLVSWLVLLSTCLIGTDQYVWKEKNAKAMELYSQGKYSEAITVAEAALILAKKVFGPNHTMLVVSMNNLAGIYRAQKKDEEAENLYEKAMRIEEKVVGRVHSNYSRYAFNLASLYFDTGKYKLAEPLFNQALGV